MTCVSTALTQGTERRCVARTRLCSRIDMDRLRQRSRIYGQLWQLYRDRGHRERMISKLPDGTGRVGERVGTVVPWPKASLVA